jgi:hypothetical protein
MSSSESLPRGEYQADTHVVMAMIPYGELAMSRAWSSLDGAE